MHKKQQAVFIDENIRVYEGDEALTRLGTKNDLMNFEPERGIIHVERSRWEEAQRYENRTWMINGKYATDDRNWYHRERFANYSSLHGLTFNQGIELGCGPFTNLRLISGECCISNISLLDPLINEYLKHKFCTYKNGRLGGLLKQLLFVPDLRHPELYLRNCYGAYRTGGIIGLPVRLISSMIENYQFDQNYDLVIMINVLEHCQDAEAVFNKVLEILSPGGTFVFADVVFDVKEIEDFAAIMYDAGHPLRIERSIVNEFLSKNFSTLMRAEYFCKNKILDLPLLKDELYFVGKRLGSGILS